MKKRRKSTMPAIIPNQPQSSWGWSGCDGQKFITEADKNERNRRRLICSPELPATIPKTNKVTGTKPLIRSKTRIRVYKSVRTINN